MDKGNRFAVLVAALGIAGTALCLSLVGPGQAAPVGVDLAAQQGEAAPAAQQSTSVEIMGYAFQPATLTINAGDTVVWTNHDTAPHNVVVTNGPEKFTSPTLQQGQTYTYTFTKPGTYSYYCSIHPDMKASVTVNGSTPTTTAPPTTTTPPTTTPPTSHPTTHPTPTTTTPPTGTPECIKKEALAPFIAHLKAAHLETSPLQQAQDALAFDNYIKAHTVLLEQMLDPVLSSSLDRDVLAPFIAHLKAAHLETSPLQQVQDALAFDNYIKAHTVLLEQMLDPAFNQAIC
ncbi:cupredoxin domain-containing protein [Lentzea flava]|uniref:Copper-binding protein n=1 Tax=Lentzea flava TaxID=103732 RepID=A0ABQ2UEJ2_9PSEU|nr:cupredoxin family copper-binding protein [Lentzea flava]MCP2197465.1 amicyanin [Lentzea flava]GGU19868.1 copper-binding protein [Lentzea flava]